MKNSLVNKGKINRMCKYYRGKNVTITYVYNNSLGHHSEHNYTGKYDSFKVEELDYASGREYNVVLKLKDKNVFEQHFGFWAEFEGVGKVKECNSGPYCYFSITHNLNPIQILLKKVKRVGKNKLWA